MKNWILCLLPLMLGPTIQKAFAQHQTVVDAPDLYLHMAGVLPAPEGGTYALAAPGSLATFVASRFTAAGALLWSRSFEPVSEAPMGAEYVVKGENNEILLGGSRAQLDLDHEGFEHDTTFQRHGFATVNADGVIGNMWTLSRRFTYDGAPLDPPSGIWRVAHNPIGGCYMMADFSSGMETLELYRLSATGQLLWARSIGRPNLSGGWPNVFPTLGETTMAQNQFNTRLVCSSAGEAYIMNFADDPWGVLKVKKIAPEGNIEWVRGYEFIGQDPNYGRCMAATIGPDDKLHVLTRYGAFGSVFAEMRIDIDGTLLSADAFDVAGPEEYTLMVGSDGQRYIGSPGVIAASMPYLNHLAPGGVVHRTQYPNLVVEPYIFRSRLDVWNLTDGQLRVAGVLNREHQIFSTVQNFPMVWSLPVESFQQCESSTSNSTYTAIPLESFNVTTDEALISVDITEQLSTEPTVLYTGSADQSSLLSAYCELNVGAPELPQVVQRHIRQNLLLMGEPLVVAPSEATHIDLMATDGRVIFSHRISTYQIKIPTFSCAPGSYMVRGSDVDGRVRWCERVMVR